MKIVREHINEKFMSDEQSDPIIDMGIGGIPSALKKLFAQHFAKFGEIDIKYDEFRQNGEPTAYIFIPYKNREQRNLLIQILEHDTPFDAIIAEDILQPNGKDLWSTRIYRSRSFKNKNKFHIKDRGVIMKIMITKFTSDSQEAEW